MAADMDDDVVADMDTVVEADIANYVNGDMAADMDVTKRNPFY